MIFTPIIPIQPMEKIDSTKPMAQPKKENGGFGSILQNAINDLETLQAKTAEDSRKLALGQIDDLAQVQINTLKASTMLQTTVQLTGRAVNAYKEIMQMQI